MADLPANKKDKKRSKAPAIENSPPAAAEKTVTTETKPAPVPESHQPQYVAFNPGNAEELKIILLSRIADTDTKILSQLKEMNYYLAKIAGEAKN